MNEEEIKQETTEEELCECTGTCNCGCDHCCGGEDCDCHDTTELTFNLISGESYNTCGHSIPASELYSVREQLQENKEIAVMMIRQLVESQKDPDSEETRNLTESIKSSIRDNLEGLGIHAPSYDNLRDDITSYEKALLMCTDYISTVSTLMNFVYEDTVNHLNNSTVSAILNELHGSFGDMDEVDEEENISN